MEALLGLWVAPDKIPVSALVADMVENALSAQLRHARDLVAFPAIKCDRLDEDAHSDSGNLLITGTIQGECFSALIDKEGISLSIGKYPSRERSIHLQCINADVVEMLEIWITAAHEVTPRQGAAPLQDGGINNLHERPVE